MKTGRTLCILSTLALGSAAVVGCGDDSSNGAGGSGTTTQSTSSSSSSGGGSGGSGQGGAGGSGGAGGGAPTAMVRVAHLSPDAPAVDFCVSAGTDFVGPVVNGLLKEPKGLAYTEVTKYLPLPAATYTIRLVAPGATDCKTPLGPKDVSGVKVDAGMSYTVAAIGQLQATGTDKPFELKGFMDDTTVTSGKAKLRFIHASADTPSVDVGLLGTGGMFTPVFQGVAFGDAKTGEVAPLENVKVSVRLAGDTKDALVLPSVSLPAGAIATAFAIGNADSMPKPLKALVCVDNAEPTNNLTKCSVLP